MRLKHIITESNKSNYAQALAIVRTYDGTDEWARKHKIILNPGYTEGWYNTQDRLQYGTGNNRIIFDRNLDGWGDLPTLIEVKKDDGTIIKMGWISPNTRASFHNSMTYHSETHPALLRFHIKTDGTLGVIKSWWFKGTPLGATALDEGVSDSFIIRLHSELLEMVISTYTPGKLPTNYRLLTFQQLVLRVNDFIDNGYMGKGHRNSILLAVQRRVRFKFNELTREHILTLKCGLDERATDEEVKAVHDNILNEFDKKSDELVNDPRYTS